MTIRKLMICGGGHCRKALHKNDRLTAAAAKLPVDVVRVRCQKICNGPVVGVLVDEKWEWFEKMGSKKSVEGLAELILEGSLGKPLRKRRVGKRSDRLRS